MREILKTYGWVLLVCLVVRAGYVLSRRELPPRAAFDGYVAIAENLLAGRGLNPSPLRHFHLRTPVYPLFVAAVWSVTPTAARYAALSAAQAALSVATCALLMSAARRVFGRNAAVAAGALFALSPSYTLFSALVYTETLHLFLLLLAVHAAARLARAARPLDAACFGGLWGVLGLNRPEATFLVPLLVLPFLSRRGVSRCRKSVDLALMLAALALVTAPWIARNYRVYGAFVPLVPAAGMNLYGGSYPRPPMYGRGWYHAEGRDHDLAYWETPEYRALVEPYWDRAALARRPRWYEEVLARSEREFLTIDRVLAAAARRQIAAEPGMFVRNIGSHFVMLWGRPAAWDVAHPGSPWRVAWFAAHVGGLALASLGVVIAARTRRLAGPAGAWPAFVAGHTLVILPIVTEPRYQATSAPFLCAFAGLAVAELAHRRSWLWAVRGSEVTLSVEDSMIPCSEAAP